LSNFEMAHDMSIKDIAIKIYENKNTNFNGFERNSLIWSVIGRGQALEAGAGKWISRQHRPITPTQAIDCFFRPTLNVPMGLDASIHSRLPATPDAASLISAELTERYRMLKALCLLACDEAACTVGVSAFGDAARLSGVDLATGSGATPAMLDVAHGAAGLVHFEQLVLQAFHNEWVGESKAAELLNMSLPNFYRWRCQQASAVT
jgi:hypothetical protein